MQYIKKNENSTDKIKIRRMRQRQHAARASEVLAEGPEGKGHSAHCKKRQSGVGISQPCAVPNAEAADMAIQSPGATWRHYNQEGRERVMRKAVLARCEAGENETGSNPHPTAAQHSRQKRQALHHHPSHQP